MKRAAVLLATAGLVSAMAQADLAASQPRAFCSGLLGAVNNLIECPEGLQEIGGAALGLICVGAAGTQPGAPPKLTAEQLEAQVQGCLPSGWSVTPFQTGAIGGRPARFREYVRLSDRLRMQIGEVTILRPASRGARTDVVELRQAFLAVPPEQ